MSKKITIVGSGAMGTAMAKVLYDANGKKIDLVVYGIDENELGELKAGLNTKYFPATAKLPKVKATSNLHEALDHTDYVVLAVPSKLMDVVVGEVIGSLNSKVLLINVAKGFFPRTEKSLHQGISDATKHSPWVRDVVSITGPSHAEEIVLEAPTTVAAVSSKKSLCTEVQVLFSNKYFRLYAQNDVKGAMAGAAYKNVLAIASGMLKELGFGINTTAALLTRGLAEMAVFVKNQGGKEKTVMGLTGIGDLIVTAMSDYSRNYTFGREFVRDAQKALHTSKTVEGLVALDFVCKIGREQNLDLPIAYFLYGLIHGQKQIKDFRAELWERKLKEE